MKDEIICSDESRRVLSVDGKAVLQFKRASGVAWRNGKMHHIVTTDEALDILENDGIDVLYRVAGCFFSDRKKILKNGKVRQVILPDDLWTKAKIIGNGNASAGVRVALEMAK